MRGIGIAFCILLAMLLLTMIISAAAFGSAKTVNIFGFNIFICESSDYDHIPAGSAVIATKCAPYDFVEGNLVLYSTDPMNKNADLSMGYYSDFKMIDGVYYLSLVNGTDTTVISEQALIGKAGWSSALLGAFISFIKTPWGIFVMAVLPCALLLLCDLLRVKAEERPLPEIIPQVKNPENEPTPPQISVGENGSASFRKNTRSVSADSVLFTYGSSKKRTSERSAPTMSDADVLSLLNAPPAKHEKEEKPDKNTVKPFVKNAPPSSKEPSEKPTLPAPVAAKRYIDNTVTPADKPKEEPSTIKAGHTAELPIPEKPKKKRSDAFFAQSEAPQIGTLSKGGTLGKGGKGLTGKQSSRSIIDLEDALAAAPSRTTRQEPRRSANILAAKDRRDLMSDDDDSRDRSRYEVDDILAGIEKRHQK